MVSNIHDLPPVHYDHVDDAKAVQYILLMSDHHIGEADSDFKLIRQELQWARKHKARVLINGDVMACIGHKDKRHTPSALHPSLKGLDDILTGQRGLAVHLLGPYIDLIDVIGTGNHESKMIKRGESDPTALLLRDLRGYARAHRIKTNVKHGAYWGVARMQFRGAQGGGYTYSIAYHHGVGGFCASNKGTPSFGRLSHYEGADVLWQAHKHHQGHYVVRRSIIPSRGGQLYYVPQHLCQTGAYTGDGYPQLAKAKGVEDAMLTYQHNWATETGFQPQGKGGLRLRLHPYRNGSRTLIWTDVTAGG